MTAPRRMLLRLVVRFALLGNLGCLHIEGTAVPSESPPPAPPREFAILPSRPGGVVRQQPAPKPNTTAKVTPAPNPITEPISELPPDGELIPIPMIAQVKAEPGSPTIAAPTASAEQPLLAVMRAYLENKPERAIELLKSLDKPNQDYVLAMMPILLRLSVMNHSAMDPGEAALLTEQIRGIETKLEARAALKVDRVVFCRKTAGFGRYEPWPEAQPYRPNDLAVLYVEVRHMISEEVPGPNGESYRTRAAVSLEVRDANGKLVEQTDAADFRRRVPVTRFDHTDHTRSPLRDYSRVYQISVPPQPGVYTVTVEVKDPVGNRTARSQPAEFRVAGP